MGPNPVPYARIRIALMAGELIAGAPGMTIL